MFAFIASSVAENVVHTPSNIADRLTTDNLTLDCLAALHEDLGDDVTILFGCSTGDGDLSEVQAYFDTGVIDLHIKCDVNATKKLSLHLRRKRDTIFSSTAAGGSRMERETNNLEYKEGMTASFLKTVSAFANYCDGRIIFGVSDDGRIIGTSDPVSFCLDM